MDNPKQKRWNFAVIFIYFILVALVGYIMQENGYNIRQISTRELIILILASYRLTRIVVFEKIFKYGRDFVKHHNRYYFFSTLQSIITCPWCAGVWMALVMVVFFYLIPFGDLLAYVLAIAGIASFFLNVVNLIGIFLDEKQGGKYRK